MINQIKKIYININCVYICFFFGYHYCNWDILFKIFDIILRLG